MPNVILADDEEFVRYFLNSVMETLEFEVVAEVEKGDELPDVMNEFNPDILLLDINMPNLTGEEFMKDYASKFPNTCIIILTASSSQDVIEKTMDAGAECFLRKDTPLKIMIQAIKEAWTKFNERRG